MNPRKSKKSARYTAYAAWRRENDLREVRGEARLALEIPAHLRREHWCSWDRGGPNECRRRKDLVAAVDEHGLVLRTAQGWSRSYCPAHLEAGTLEMRKRAARALKAEPSSPRTVAATRYSTRGAPSPPAERKGDGWWGWALVLLVVLGGGWILWSGASNSGNATNATNARPPASSYSQSLIITSTPDAPIVLPKPTPLSLPALQPTAICMDGTYSFSQTRRGTCSHHGGVRVWG